MSIEEKKTIEQQRQMLVYKSNDLIQKSRYDLTLQEQKLILYLISKIQPTDDDFKFYEFDLKELCNLLLIQTAGTNYERFKNSINSLHKKNLWIDTPTSQLLVHWIETVKINKGDTKVSIKLNAELKPFLLNLKEYFTSYILEEIIYLNSIYAIRLFELLFSYKNQKELIISVDDLKEKFCIKNKYKSFKDFRIKVLEKAVAEINDKTKLIVSYKTIKESRSIKYIHFYFDELDDFLVSNIDKKRNQLKGQYTLDNVLKIQKQREKQKHE